MDSLLWSGSSFMSHLAFFLGESWHGAGFEGERGDKGEGLCASWTEEEEGPEGVLSRGEEEGEEEEEEEAGTNRSFKEDNSDDEDDNDEDATNEDDW